MIITTKTLRDELNRLANAVGRKPIDSDVTMGEWMAELRKIGATPHELRRAIDHMRAIDREWYGFPPVANAVTTIKASRSPDPLPPDDTEPWRPEPGEIRAMWEAGGVDMAELEQIAKDRERRTRPAKRLDDTRPGRAEAPKRINVDASHYP